MYLTRLLQRTIRLQITHILRDHGVTDKHLEDELVYFINELMCEQGNTRRGAFK